jgi:hypothetical protein
MIEFYSYGLVWENQACNVSVSVETLAWDEETKQLQHPERGSDRLLGKNIDGSNELFHTGSASLAII